MGKSDKFKIDHLNNQFGNGDTKKSGIENIEMSSKPDKKKDKKKKDEKPEPTIPPVAFFALFRFASGSDKLLLLLGTITAIVSGVCTPAMVILFGEITDTLVNNGKEPSNITSSTISPSATTEAVADDDFLDTLGDMAMYMALLGLATLILIYTFVTCFNIVSEQQVHRIRQNYLKALLRQNIGWYDTTEDRSFVSRIAEDVMKIQEATSEKVGLCIYFMAVCVFSLANAFWHGWKLTLVVLSSAPVLAIVSGIVATIQSKLTQDEQGSYAKAGKVAEEVITNIRTVFAFGGQEKEIQRYADGLVVAQKAGKRRGLISGFGVGLMWLIIYASYALAFWYGTKLIVEDEYTAATLLIVFFSVLMGAFNIGQSASYFEAFATGRGAAAAIYDVIDRIPEIDSYNTEGKKPASRATGRIEFRGVKFEYPSRQEVQVLKGLSLTIQAGQTVALVGHSGCGKSTLLQLLQRFYDPSEGQIMLDDTSVKDLNLEWLRSQIGVVSQEPVLFNCSIAENIKYGREGVSQQEVEDAARKANAHSFIRKLPNGYNTVVGNRGTQLSGGQKQRIAIARAIIRECPILLLDEATSALDTQSESIVQGALDRARLGRTTLIVAHRLSTIRNADVVVSIDNGQVQEQGTHDELLEKKGLYYQLVTTQMAGHEDDDTIAVVERDEAGNKHLVVRKSIPNDDEDVVDYTVTATEDAIDEDDLAKQVSLLRLLKLNMKELPYIIVGVISAIIQGAALPFYAIIFGEFLGALAKPDPQSEANKFALYFLGIGIVAGTSQFLQIFAFTFSGEALTMRLRKMSFAAILKQEPGWFDDPNRSIGALCSRLSGDAASVNGATGSRIGTLVQAISTLSIAVGMSMYFIPKLGAVAMAFVPVVLLGTYFEGKLMTTQNVGEKKALENAAKVAVEAVSNIRTVASLGKEKAFVKIYVDNVKKPHKNSLKRAHVRGLIFGVAQSVPLLAYATVLYYGGYLIEHEGYPYADVFKVAEALIFGSMMIGQAMSFAPNYNKAKVSGARILRLLDRRPIIENSPGVGLKIKDSKGSVEFEDVSFCYPTRPTAKILKGLSFEVEPGQNIALVGHSGCGKSSCINLILRFYDPITGTVKLDDLDIARLNVASLRSQMSIVSQEPALFDRTLRDNICYGDNSREVKMEEVIEAAKLANIHSFISALPAQYETMVGEMGSKLSGGQKQRVAIARALVKSPRVLLLDEATSALDTESEKVVQEALDAASTGRTTITIAHRLSSIQNSDKIFVINNGVLAEAGTHSQLLQFQGIYSRLWNMQQGNSSANR